MNILLAIESVVMVVALSTDAFVACFAYGTEKIKVPFTSVITIDLICSLTLTVALLVGSVVRPYLPETATKIVCFCILFLLGLIKLFDSYVKAFIQKHSGLKKELKFSFLNLNFILNVYADPNSADTDCSKHLSPSEAALLAAAVSLDGIAVGFGAGLGSINIWFVLICSLLSTAIAVICGYRLGNTVADKINVNLSWLGGALLIALAFMKI